MQPISCRLSPGLLPSLLTASGAVKPPPPKKVTRHQNLVQLLQKSSLRFFTRRNLVQHQEGLTSNMYYWKPCCTSWCQLTLSLLVFHQRSVFSTLVQALHQFRILTGASSSQVLAKSHDGGGGCTKKKAGWSPSITRAGRLGWRQSQQASGPNNYVSNIKLQTQIWPRRSG